MGRNISRGKVAYSWISPDSTKAGPTLEGGGVVVISRVRSSNIKISHNRVSKHFSTKTPLFLSDFLAYLSSPVSLSTEGQFIEHYPKTK